ncbi:MAG: glutamine amidotransferase, partial [Frondihabitans sp.]|nr:glutamine amidotransferase [Frondihabitans sp.]
LSTFSGGEVFRSGCTFRRGNGKIFFFSPGDQDFPVYHHTDVRRVLANGVEWARPERERALPTLNRFDLGEYFDGKHYAGPFDHPLEAPASAPESASVEA